MKWKLALFVVLGVVFVSIFLINLNSVNASGEQWYNNSWQYRINITINNSKVLANLTDFPIYLNLSNLSSGFHSNVNSTGKDIRITTSDGATEVPREVVFYNSTTDKGEVWFKGNISNVTETIFYIYYGNPSASDYAVADTYGRNAVWSNGYVAVYHLNEADIDGGSGDIKDSTFFSNNGTTQSMETADSVSAKIEQGFSLDGENEFVDLGNTSSLAITGAITVSAWTRLNTASAINDIFTRDLSSSDRGWRMGNEADGTGFFYVASTATTRVQASSPVAANSFVYWTGTYSPSTYVRLYYNGTLVNENTASVPASQRLSTVGTDLGSRGNGVLDSLNGTIDEARISNVTRTTEWIATEYNNQNSSATFYSVGESQPVSCTYISGNWAISCSDSCNITSNVNLGGNNVSITGTGTTTITGNITNFVKASVQGTDSSNICTVRVLNGGGFKD